MVPGPAAISSTCSGSLLLWVVCGSGCSRPAGYQPELFFDDELNQCVAENALQRAKVANEPVIFLCGYGEGTQAVDAGDHVVVSIAGNPDWRFVLLDCRARRSVNQQLRNLCKQFLGLMRLGTEGIREHAQFFYWGLVLSAYGNGWDLEGIACERQRETRSPTCQASSGR